MAKLKLTPELEKELCSYIAQGFTKKAAVYAVGISEVTFYAWLNRGEDDLNKNKQTVFSNFFKSINKAETAHKLSRLKVIRQAATNGTWQAAAWELERRYPNEYGRLAMNAVYQNRRDKVLDGIGEDDEEGNDDGGVIVYVPDNGRGGKE